MRVLNDLETCQGAATDRLVVQLHNALVSSSAAGLSGEWKEQRS